MELKTLKEVINYDEFITLWNINHKYHYYGYKKLTELEKNEIEKKQNLKDFKEHKIFKTFDNKIIVINVKPKISNNYYYDDETTPPDVKNNYEFFKNWNIKDNLKDYTTEWKQNLENICNYYGYSNPLEKPFIIGSYCTDKECKQVSVIYYTRNDDNYYNNLKLRELTSDEVYDLITIEKAIKDDYITRLENYFKKFNKNIHTTGYWANR